MDKRKVIETLFDSKVIKILRLFINNPTDEYYLREIARQTRVSPATTYRILQTMKQLELLHEYKTKHLKTYALNAENAKLFIDMLEDKRSALQEFTEFVSSLSSVELAVLQGKAEKDKASVLVVGNNIDQEEIRLKTVELKQKYGFNLIHLVLNPQQYDQMINMGLYPGRKEILYQK